MQPKHRDSGSVGLVTKLIRWLTPIDEDTKQRLTNERWEDVNAEFSRHQGLAEFFCFVGMFTGVAIAGIFRPMQPWDISVLKPALANTLAQRPARSAKSTVTTSVLKR